MLRPIRNAIKSALYPFYEWRIVSDLDFSKTPRHVGVILDGNRRFAKANPSELDPKGHRRGASKIVEFLGWCDEAKVEVVTLWLLSTENFKRTPEELDGLLRIIAETVNELHATGKWNIKAVGALDLLPTWMSEKLANKRHIPSRGQKESRRPCSSNPHYLRGRPLADQQTIKAVTLLRRLTPLLEISLRHRS